MSDSTNKTVNIGIRVNEHFRKRIEKHAAVRHLKMSEFIREAIEREMREMEEEERKAGMK